MYLNWSRGTSPQLGLAYAGESGRLLTWASPPQLTLWQAGEVVQHRQAAQPLQAGACAADGKTFALAATSGKLWLLGEDLRTRWEIQLPAPALALALDPLGELLAAADSGGGVHLLRTATAKELWRNTAPRALHHLTFVPEYPLLVGAADTGVVLAFDPKGVNLWRAGLAAHIGSLAVQHDGQLIVVAGFGEGACCFDAAGQRRQVLTRIGPCRRLALSYDGRIVLFEDLAGKLHLTTSGCVPLGDYTPQGRVLDFALTPLADAVVLGLQEGGLQELGLRR